MWSNCARICSSTSRDSREQFAVASRDKRSNKPPQSSSPRPSHRKASILEGTNNFSKVVQERSGKDADYRKCLAHTKPWKVGTMSKWTSENPQQDAAAKAGAILEIGVMSFKLQLQDPTRYQRVYISLWDTHTALE